MHPSRAALTALLLGVLAAAAARADDFDAIRPRLAPAQREALDRHAQAWARLTPAAQAVLRQRLQAWDAQPAAVRGERRERYRAFVGLPAAERVRIDIARREYAALPAAQQQALRARFDMLDESTRRGWRLGPTLGADYAALQPLLAQVPGDERLPLLDVLRAMTPAQRAQLAALAQRTPPAARDALRRDLLVTPPAGLQAWLWARLDR